MALGYQGSPAAQEAAMLRGEPVFNRICSVAVLALMAAWPAVAAADPIEDFYKGKQIRVVIRAAPGGNYDLYSRLLIRHMVRFIPGHPTGLPVNMPGGSGLTALNYVADVHPKDGTVLTMVTQTFPLEQALNLNDKLKVDLRRLNWIGNMSDSSNVLLTSRASLTRSIDDAKRRETIIGVPSLGDASAWLTLVTNGTLGTRFKLIPGYNSGPDMNLAMERGEIDGRGTSNPKAMFNGGSETGPRRAAAVQFPAAVGTEEEPGLSQCAAAQRPCDQRGAEGDLRFRLQGGFAGAAADHQCRRAAGTRRCAPSRLRRHHEGPRLPGRGSAPGHGDHPDGRRGAAAARHRHRQRAAGGRGEGAAGGEVSAACAHSARKYAPRQSSPSRNSSSLPS